MNNPGTPAASLNMPCIDYVLDSVPETGAVHDISAGIKWLRLPLPFLLNHINVWLLRDGDGWALVDTGIFTSTTREVWDYVLEHHLQSAPITRVLVTHLHPDHVGCAGWMTGKFNVDLWMSREEYLLCRVLVADTGRAAPSIPAPDSPPNHWTGTQSISALLVGLFHRCPKHTTDYTTA